METLLLLLLLYVTAGAMFAVAFLSRGVHQVDPAARGASLGFRLLLFPGCVALWPYLAMLWRHPARRRNQ